MKITNQLSFMAEENESVQVDAQEQEDNASAEIIIEDESPEEEVITVSKKEFSKMKRKALAYEATSKKPKEINNAEVKPYNILEDEVADLILGGHTKDEVKFILANGGRKALEDKDSYVSIAINAKREQKRTEDAVSQTSNKGFVSPGGKTYSEDQLKNMSAEEMEKVLPHA